MQTPPTLDAFVDACVPLAANRDHDAVVRLLDELISNGDFAASVPAFGEFEPSPSGWVLGGEHLCYQSDELSILVLDTLPGVIQPPHDHHMQAIIGVFAGEEEQRFFAQGANGVSATTERSLIAGDTIVLGTRAIHAISAPPGRPARAVHVYFGDIYNAERFLYDPDTLEPHAYTGERYDEFCRPDTR